MPEAISRSSVSQIASYGPPEPLASEPSAAPATMSTSVAPEHDLHAASTPLDRPESRALSYEKCIAQHEQKRSEAWGKNAAGAGCLGALVALKGAGGPLASAGACTAAAITAYYAASSAGTTVGRSEGTIACDDLPKKL